MGLAIIQNPKLHESIEEQLIDLVTGEDYRPGDRLPSERELAAQLGVGRGSVRQAVIALELAGVLEVRVSSGIFVSDEGLANAYRRPSPQGGDIPPLDIIRARRAVEGETAALAAGHATRAQIEGIAAVQEEFERRDRRYDLRHPSDRGFHLAIAQASGNAALAAMVEALWEMQRGRLYERMEDYFSTASMRDYALRDHALVLDALRDGDPKRARTAMHRHLDRIYTGLATSALALPDDAELE